MRIGIFWTLFFFLGTTTLAQREPPVRGTATATIDGSKVTIDYGRPSLKGRSASELLKEIPQDRVWRAGANQVTTLTAEGDIMIGDQKLPAGKYSLYVHIPQSGNWSLLVNKDPGMPLSKIFAKAPPQVANELWPRMDGYEENIAKDEVVRAAMKAGRLDTAVDLFTIDLSPSKDGSTLTMSWGDQFWYVDIKSADR